MGRRVGKTRGGERYTEAGYFGFIRSGLRQKSMKWPPKYDVMNKAKRPYNGPDKRRKFEYLCAGCEQWCAGKDVAVDHIVECGSLKTFEDLPRFVATLFCEEDNLQVLCKDCHNIKTQEAKKK
jgi:5-methylcytosine-specific restriction endonuclease McrA